MNRRGLISRVAEVMRDNEIKKPISLKKQVFHISDDAGNSKDFVVKQSKKNVLYTIEDVGAVLDACVSVIEECLKKGEPVTIQGFGSLGLKYRAARSTKRPDTGEFVEVSARYIPKFTFGNDLRLCAKLFEMSLEEKEKSISDEIDEEEYVYGD